MAKYQIEFIIPKFIMKDIINYVLNDDIYTSFTTNCSNETFKWKISVTSDDKLKLQELSEYVIRKINNTEIPELLNTNVHPGDKMCINCTSYRNKKCILHNTQVLYYELCKSFNPKYIGVFK